MTDDNATESLHRSLPHSLRNVVGELELRAVTLVSGSEIASYAGVPAGSPQARAIIRRLVGQRWLNPLPVQGRYEFLPGVAGPFSRHDDLDTLRALFDAGTPGQVALGGAAFLRGFLERAPAPIDILVPRPHSVRLGLRQRYRFHFVEPERIFGATLVDGVLASTPERLLVDVALWPETVGAALRDREHWLGRALADASAEVARLMLARLDSPVASARAGYLAAAFGRPDIADNVATMRRSRVAVPLIPGVEAGPDAKRDRRFNVIDPVGVSTIS
jgi:predicted transcriptional regulator of viral defense system